MSNTEPRAIPRQCTQIKRNGDRCQASAMHGAKKCNKHGGILSVTRRGKNNQNYKHGRYSRYPNMSARIEELEHDPDLLSQLPEIKILTKMLSEQLDNVDAGMSLPLWAMIDRAYRDFDVSLATGNVKDRTESYAKMREIIDRGLATASSSIEARALIEQRRKVVESERKRSLEAGQALALDQAISLFQQLQQIVLEEIHDAKVIKRIRARTARIFEEPEGVIDVESKVA